MSASASGADTGGAARSREHNQGNQGRSYTVDQKAAVLRIRRCSPTSFYEILGLEDVKTTCTESDIKKAYRKQSLLTHPDKNGHEHADEAFKMVSRAFGILGDKEKREKFDRFGTDPDSRFGQAQAQSNPFSGFAGRQGGGGGGRGFEQEMTPEEMFQRFFGGGGFGGPFGGFDNGPQFVFNMGGGPGFRVHQFGGARPRRRPQDPRQAGQEERGGGISTLISLLPVLLFFIFPLLSSLFSGESRSSLPTMRFNKPDPPTIFTEQRATFSHKTPYWVNPRDLESYTDVKRVELDKTADQIWIQNLRNQCHNEMQFKNRLVDEATGFFFQDAEKIKTARSLPMTSCKQLDKLGIRR